MAGLSQQQVAVVCLYIDFLVKLSTLCRRKNYSQSFTRGAFVKPFSSGYTISSLQGRTHRTKLGGYVSEIAQLISGVVGLQGIVA